MPLRVTVELVPFGNDAAAREVQTVEVTNVDRLPNGTGHRYSVAASGGRRAVVDHHSRDGAEALAAKALAALFL